MLRGLVAVLVVMGCGRMGFGPPSGDGAVAGDGSAGDAVDGSGVDADPSSPNIVFSTMTTGQIGSAGIAGADADCQAAADAASLGGTYVAWLSTTQTPATARLAGSRGWVRPDGTPVVDTVEDLEAGRMLYPIIQEADGSMLPMDVGMIVYTGTTWTGSAFIAGENCVDFTTPGGSITDGSVYGTTRLFTDRFSFGGCNSPVRVYCFGVGHSFPVSASPTAGRLAFVTRTVWLPTSGLAGADSACMNAASAASLTGTYRAFLATSTATAASRFSSVGSTWVRPDGLRLAPTAAAFLARAAGVPEVPIVLEADGKPASTGFMRAYVGTTSENCSNWSSTAGTGVTGRLSTSNAFDGSAVTCGAAERLYCLQE